MLVKCLVRRTKRVFIVNLDGLDTNAFSLKGDSDISVKCSVEP